MITLENTIQAAHELEVGDNAPSVKFALWVAALSTQQTLEKNGKLARLLAPYVHKDLPDGETLYQYLKQAKGVLYHNHLNSLYHTQDLEKTVQLNGLEHIGSTYAEQVAWRDRVFKLCTKHGLGYKTISFAALLLDPSGCELVPIDRHVMNRLGYPTSNSPATRPKYLKIEQEVMDEREQEGLSIIPLGTYHWYKWDQWRERESWAYKGNGTIESHAALNCRMY